MSIFRGKKRIKLDKKNSLLLFLEIDIIITTNGFRQHLCHTPFNSTITSNFKLHKYLLS